MATKSVTVTFDSSYNHSYQVKSGHNEYKHFGYGPNHRNSSVYKLTMPQYNGLRKSLTISISVDEGKAYPETIVASRWNMTLDSEGPEYSSKQGKTLGSKYAAGTYTLNDTSYTKTFPSSGTVSIKNNPQTFTITYTNISDAMFGSGEELYVYLYSDTGNRDIIRTTGMTATLEYVEDSEEEYESKTKSTLMVSYTNSSFDLETTISPKTKTLYWQISNLQDLLNDTTTIDGKTYTTYKKFYLYAYKPYTKVTVNSNGSINLPTGEDAWDLLDSFDNPKTASYSCYDNVTLPSSSFKLWYGMESSSVVAIAELYDGRLYKIGTASDDSTLPVKRKVVLHSPQWFNGSISCNVIYDSNKDWTTQAVIEVTHRVGNKPHYLKEVGISTESLSASDVGTDTFKGTNLGSVKFTDTSTSGIKKNITLTNLIPGKNYTLYPYAAANTTYAVRKYHELALIDFTTDDVYTGITGNLIINPTSVTIPYTISCKNNNSNNLDGYIYYSTSDNLTSKPSTSIAYDSSSLSKDITISNLTTNKQYTYFMYVYSKVTDTLYKVGSISFITYPENWKGSYVKIYKNGSWIDYDPITYINGKQVKLHPIIRNEEE